MALNNISNQSPRSIFSLSDSVKRSKAFDAFKTVVDSRLFRTVVCPAVPGAALFATGSAALLSRWTILAILATTCMVVLATGTGAVVSSWAIITILAASCMAGLFFRGANHVRTFH
jgi:hypothetical protein